MKKELTLRLTDTIGECEIEVETMKGHDKRIEVCFRIDKNLSGLFEFEDYQIGMLAEFFLKAYNEIKTLNELK